MSQAIERGVRNGGGPITPALRRALQRKRMPAAMVVFVHEKLAPETASADKGPRYAVLLADRALRLSSDPRTGDDVVTGLFELIEQTRATLDHYAIDTGQELIPLAQHMAESDDREFHYVCDP